MLPTDMDTSMERDQLMRVLLPLDLMLTLKLTLIMAIWVDTTDHTMDMAMDTWERRKGLLRLMPILMRMLTQRLILTQVLRLMLTLTLGGAIMDTPMAAIMAMVTIPMDTTGAESNQYKHTRKTKTFQQH